jgi:hypothetical protein
MVHAHVPSHVRPQKYDLSPHTRAQTCFLGAFLRDVQPTWSVTSIRPPIEILPDTKIDGEMFQGPTHVRDCDGGGMSCVEYPKLSAAEAFACSREALNVQHAARRTGVGVWWEM